MKLILASNSPRRREILTQIGINYEIVPSTFEEQIKPMEPHKLVMHFAYMKALDVSKRVEDSITIGADTIVYLDEIMGKPKSEDDAYKMLKKLSGRDHFVMTGICVIDSKSGKYICDFEKTKVSFRELSDKEIVNYINTKEPLDKAGAYAIQGIGSLFVKGIEGCYFNVVGLPIYKLSLILKQFNILIL